MATKLTKIAELYAQTMSSLSGSIENWTGFLQTAARMYKYPFHDQILIHAQRPDATACASFDLWNNRMKRYINRGATGIALLDDSGQRPILRYVFDVSDTNTRSTAPVQLWQIHEADQSVVLEELANQFGAADGISDLPFEQQLFIIVSNAIADNISDYAAMLYEAAPDSSLEELDESGVELILTAMLEYSVSYVCLARAGLDVDAFSQEYGMEYPISIFDTPAVLSCLGQATSDISEMVLRQMERSVRENQRTEREIFAKEQPIEQNEEKSIERGVENEPLNDTDRLLQDTGIDIEPAAGGGDRQIWADAQTLLEGAETGAVQPHAADGNALPAPIGDRSDGAQTGTANHSADGAGRGRDGSAQTERPDGMGAADEQHQAPGRGDGDNGDHQQLGLFPTEAQQIQSIEEAEAAQASAFSISQEEIDRSLLDGTGFRDGKLRVYQHMQEQHTAAETAAFLKNEYGIGGRTYFFLDGSGGYLDWDTQGYYFRHDSVEQKLRITWNTVAKRLRDLISADRYLTNEEKAYYPAYIEKHQLEIQAARQREDARYAEVAQERANKTYRFAQGDTVHIGWQEHIILSLDSNTVTLSDPNFPLLSEDMPRDVFERRMRESSRNDKFMVSDGEPTEPEVDLPIEEEQQNSAQPEQTADGAALKSIAIDPSPNTEPEPVEEAPEPAKPVNFRITDDTLGHGGQKTKYGYNIAAIRTLLQIEAERRHATPEEQEILSRYVGWGGIPQAFDENNDKWTNEYAELKSLLSEKEYETARSTTLNAHYTSPIVIKAMYETLSRMGFETGNVLEPALGIGNFFGLLPESMEKSKLYGTEIDSVTGRIAQQLYPNARIAVQGYEDTNLPDSFFDVAIGNVPFGSYGIADKRYDKNKFHIHDYFFAKTLDKVRPGGVIAFITSKGTLDKKNPEVRKYIAQRAELLGAVRLPSNAFLANAGTEVTTDILFLQKRDAPIEVEPGWVHLAQTADGVPVNAYYTDHPEMVLGRMAFDRSMYGNEKETACIPIDGADLAEQLREALSHIEGSIPAYSHEQELDEDTLDTIPADPDVRNFSYTLVEGKIYYRENSIMRPVETSITGANRIRGMVELRDCVRHLIDMQLADYPDADIEQEQQRLNTLYDAYTQKYGMLNSRGNEMAFSEDSGYFLLCSLEILDDEQNFKCKADMFTKRTIRPQMVITSAENAGEALAASLSERGKVDMPYMMELSGLSEDAIMEQLHGVLFQDLHFFDEDRSKDLERQRKKVLANPQKEDDLARVRVTHGGSFIYRTSDEFLSGNVREKLRRYEHLLSIAPEDYEHLALLQTNVDALRAVQPKDLSASEIDVRLGATWLPAEDIKQFMDELVSPDAFDSERTQVHYSAISGNWNIANKASGRSNVKVQRTYGTSRINAYHILENTLNLRDVRVFDTVWEDGKEKRVLNAKETMIAQQRQQAIKDAFQNWIWADPQRRERLARLYNDTFNCIQQREFDGSHLTFPGMNPEIKLNPHQVNAIARGIYGGNELLAHCVGAGKTFTMAALAMKCKQIGLTHKSMIVVPNHIIGQFAGEFLQLYPSANILVANKKDFEPARRKKFCARIATGDYDAVIIGHSQFEKIPVSVERRQMFLENQIDDLMQAIREAKAEKAENFTIKQMEGMRKSLEVKLKRLNDTTRKDNVIDFEMLGVDRLFVDEADNYKNLFLQTKMRNVAGIAQTEAQKSSDMYMKSQYINEITDYRGMVFATGTPISNSMVELYTMQRYLQPQTLRFHALHHFDSWAATFGERVTALEIAPEGTGYRLKTRFAKFFNLPELMSMFRLVADIQTKDMLNLPTPKVNYHTIALKPSEIQQEMIKSLAERAENVRKGTVDPREDNMLAITNDGRKLALDQRLVNPLLPDEENSKANECAEQVFATWERTKDERYTQLIFCDLSTPKKDGSFNVYDDIREKLIAKGVPPEEIAFIHSANTDERKIRLFSHVRAGNVRILMGSTAKMGAGTNVQRLLKAEHHLDCPWRPRDVEQREGRIERQGNENDEVDIYRYVKEGSFDSFLWQTVETKQKFISQVMTGRTPVRSCEDMDEAVLNYAEVKALAAGDPDIKERMQLDTDIKRLKLLQSNYLSNKYELEDMVNKHYPARIAQLSSNNEAIRKDIALYEQHKSDDFPGMEICGMHFTEKAKAGAALLETCKAQTELKPHPIGKYCGFALLLSFNPTFKKYALYLEGTHRYELELGSDIHGNIQRLDNCLKGMPDTVMRNEQTIAEIQRQMENAAAEITKPFAQEFDLAQKQARLIELDAKLKIGEHFNEAVALDMPEERAEREEIVLER